MIQLPFPLSFVGGQIKNTKLWGFWISVSLPHMRCISHKMVLSRGNFLSCLSSLLQQMRLWKQLYSSTPSSWCWHGAVSCDSSESLLPSGFLTSGTSVSNCSFLGVEALSAVRKRATAILKLGSHLQWFVELLSLWSGSAVDHPGISAYPCRSFNNVNSV